MVTRTGANEDNPTNVWAEKEIALLKEKADDLENQSTRSNVKIVNISERSEGNDVVDYVESLIPRLFGVSESKTILQYTVCSIRQNTNMCVLSYTAHEILAL